MGNSIGIVILYLVYQYHSIEQMSKSIDKVGSLDFHWGRMRYQ